MKVPQHVNLVLLELSEGNLTQNATLALLVLTLPPVRQFVQTVLLELSAKL